MLAPAADLHARALVIDGHTDSLVRRLERGAAVDLAAPDDAYHLDLPRLRQGGVTAIFCYVGSTDLARALRLLDATHQMVGAHPDDFILALTADDVRVAKVTGRVAMVPQLESLTCCMGELGVLRALWRLGVRVGNLTHGEAAEYGCQGDKSVFDYCTPADRERMRREMAGLTKFGRAAIREMNRLGILVDLAHANDATFFEALECSSVPPIFSHGGVFAICPHSRGLTDDQIRALAAAGGVHGVAGYRKFVHQEHPDLPTLVDQIEHSINLVGPDHVGLGSDFDGLPEGEVPIPPHAGLLGQLTEEMCSRGWDESTITKVLGANFLRVLDQAISSRELPPGDGRLGT